MFDYGLSVANSFDAAGLVPASVQVSGFWPDQLSLVESAVSHGVDAFGKRWRYLALPAADAAYGVLGHIQRISGRLCAPSKGHPGSKQAIRLSFHGLDSS